MATKNYMDVEDRGQNLEVRGRKRGILLWERLPCPEPVDGQPRSYDFNDSNEFNDLPLTGIGIQDEVSAFMSLFPDSLLKRSGNPV